MMTSGTWLNTDAKSLQAYRGRFVLLDFWFIGCGPCHRDMPQIKVAHDAFPSDKFAVVSVHTNSMKPEVVQTFADENEMPYAIVVDDARGQISKEYRALGVDHYPSYLLIAPDGNILLNDAVPDGVPTSLRQHKLELIHHAIQSWDRYANDRPSRTNQTDTVDWSCSKENAGIIIDAMALLRLAEWVLLSKQPQGCSSCDAKTPPRADRAATEPGCPSESLEAPPAADSKQGLRCTDKDARSGNASSHSGAER